MQGDKHDGLDQHSDAFGAEGEMPWPEPEAARFHYWLQGDGVDGELWRDKELLAGATFEGPDGEWLVAVTVDVPDPDGVRLVTTRRLHPLPTDP
jgi:hypothetical protein